MNQISGTTPADAQDDGGRMDAGPTAERSEVVQPGFGARGRMRRRARFLRRARELAYRDLGGLVFNLHRFGQRNDALVMAKLTTLGHIDTELRTLETALDEHRSITVLREAGITACARCAAIHSSEDHFCPNCGLSLGRHADLPIAGAAASPATRAPVAEPAANPPDPVAPATETPNAAVESEAADPGASEPEAGPEQSISGASPVPARAPDVAPPGRPRPTRSGAGRSPTPRGTPAAPAPSAPSETSSGEEEPTEILRPPSAGT